MAPLHAPSAASVAAALSFVVASSSSSSPSYYAAALVPIPTAFRPKQCSRPSAPSPSSSSTSSLRMGFLGDLFGDAFDNDANLSSDKGLGQLEGPGVDEGRTPSDLTDVQKTFLASQQAQARTRAARTSGEGAPIDPSLLGGTSWVLDLYLAGIPERDPSNDLYAAKINISNRDRSVGLGASVPTEPTVSVSVTLKEDGTCAALPSDFTSGEVEGEWKLSDDCRYLRLSVDALGYKRTVQTKGTIQKVFWSDSDEISSKTSSAYSIPAGLIYGDIPVGYGLPGQLVMRGMGTLSVEEKSGFMGATSKMITCGKFEGTSMEVEEGTGDKKGAL